MSTTTKIIRAVMKKAMRKKPKAIKGKMTEKVISEADIGRRKPNFTQAQVDEMLKKDKLKEFEREYRANFDKNHYENTEI